jgi:hypothetical protein
LIDEAFKKTCVVKMGVGNKDMTDPATGNCRKQRIKMLVERGSWIDDSQFVFSDNEGVRTVKRKRTWIDRRDTANIIAQVNGAAVPWFELKLEFQAFTTMQGMAMSQRLN